MSQHILALGLLLATSCAPSGETQIVEKLINVEVAGTPQCLAQVVNLAADQDISLAVLPRWSGGKGLIEIGPLVAQRYGDVANSLNLLGCVKNVRPRPCSTPNSDLKVC